MGSLAYFLRQYKWIIIIPGSLIILGVADWMHTQKWKAELAALKNEISVRDLTGIKRVTAVEEEVNIYNTLIE